MRLFNASFWRVAIRRWPRIGAWTLSAFGALWLVLEILVHFKGAEFATSSRDYYWPFIMTGIVVGLIAGLPRLHTTLSRIQGGDVRLHVRVVDMFKVPGTSVVPTNSRFDMDIGGVAEKANSVQAEVIRRFYGGRASRLQRDIDQMLGESAAAGEREPEYALGTTVALEHGAHKFYFTAVDKLTENGRAEATYDDGIEALRGLWQHVATKGDRAHLVVPLIGTGKGRVKNLGAEHAVERTIKTFLDANAEKTLCDEVTVCILPSSFEREWFDLQNITRFATSQVRYLAAAQQAR